DAPRQEFRVFPDIGHKLEELVRTIRDQPAFGVRGHQTAASAACRAARKAAKSASAWYELRVSGVAETSRNPLARASAAYSANSSGVTKRSTAACLTVGWRYWPMVRK